MSGTVNSFLPMTEIELDPKDKVSSESEIPLELAIGDNSTLGVAGGGVAGGGGALLCEI